MINSIDEKTGKPKIILHLCAKMGSDSQPYADAGYDVRIIGEDIGVENYNPPENVYGIIANPPCTMFSFCRTHAKEPRNLYRGMLLVNECLRIISRCQERIKKDTQKYPPLKFWMLENPNGMLKWFLGNPPHEYSPYEYGDMYKKRTQLWGLFNMPIKTHEHKDYAKHMKKFDMMRSKDIAPQYFGKLTRQERRSICSQNFAKAFFEANQ